MTTAAAAVANETHGASDTPPDFECCGGTLRDLDDGHTPETHDSPGQYVDYGSIIIEEHRRAVHVLDDAISTALLDDLYETTVKEGQPWGTYVTLDEVERYRGEQDPSVPADNDDHPATTAAEKRQHALSIQAVSEFLRLMTDTEKAISAKENNSEICYHCVPPADSFVPPLEDSTTLLSNLLADNAVHGVAVWALASDTQSKVPYHVDYAEYIRYRYNVLVPPLWAGTLHCSRYVVRGGEFAVQRQGWAHYERYGYKGCKQQKEEDADMGGWKRPASSEQLMEDDVPHWDADTDWVTVPYRFNRCIGHVGTLPHVSAPFELIESNKRRVIVGFNVFGQDVGRFVQAVPEHSHEFRRRVQAPRRLSLETIRSNPKLTKLLVLAKREKVKRDLQIAQETLDCDLERLLAKEGENGARVQELLQTLGSTDGTWPSPQDVEVHLECRLREGVIATTSTNPSKELTVHDMVYWKKSLT